MTSRPARLLLSGYYGFGNFGDESILRVFVDQWRARRPTDALTVLSAQPAQTASTYNVAAAPRMDARAISAAIAEADLVVSGGGGLLQSATSLRSVLYYAGIVREAKRAGKTAAIFAQGVGPLDFFGKQIVKRMCGRADLAIVRDAASAALAHSLLPHVPIELGADPVFLAPTDAPPEAAAVLARDGLSGLEGDLIAVAVRKSPMLHRIADDLAAGIDRLSSAFRAQVVFVPLQRPDDAEAAIEIIRRCRSAPTLLGGGYDLGVMSALFSRCAAVVSMRLHALILAARLAVPFLALPYDPKVKALEDELHYPLRAFEHGRFDPDAFARLLRERAEISAHLRTAVAPLAARASASFDRLALLAEGTATQALKRTN